MEKMVIATNDQVQPSIADYAKESLARLRETRGVLAAIQGNITSNRGVGEEDGDVTCLLDNMAEIKETAMQLLEIARMINMELFNE